MDAILLLREAIPLSETAVAELVVWQLPRALPGSVHSYKYRLALIVEGTCVLRFDNEAGKGDHKHLGKLQIGYRFIGLEDLQIDFWKDVEEWLNRQNAS